MKKATRKLFTLMCAFVMMLSLVGAVTMLTPTHEVHAATTKCPTCGSYNTTNSTSQWTTYSSAQTGTASWSHTIWSVYKCVYDQVTTTCHSCGKSALTGSTLASKTLWSYFYKCGQCSGSGSSNTCTSYGTSWVLESEGPASCWCGSWGYKLWYKDDTLKCAAGNCTLTHIRNYEKRCSSNHVISYWSTTY